MQRRTFLAGSLSGLSAGLLVPDLAAGTPAASAAASTGVPAVPSGLSTRISWRC